jgi:hypothetical protein
MVSSPKIVITIPKSLNVTAEQKAALKKAFNADVVRVLKKPKTSLGNEIINVKSGGGGASRRPSSKGKARKKAGKKR